MSTPASDTDSRTDDGSSTTNDRFRHRRSTLPLRCRVPPPSQPPSQPSNLLPADQPPADLPAGPPLGLPAGLPASQRSDPRGDQRGPRRFQPFRRGRPRFPPNVPFPRNLRTRRVLPSRKLCARISRKRRPSFATWPRMSLVWTRPILRRIRLPQPSLCRPTTRFSSGGASMARWTRSNPPNWNPSCCTTLGSRQNQRTAMATTTIIP
mmetsp:Transcript_17083/g.46960  ORF Transcript_17083/g.46960 Transcript_17083/m.46960 type:complete len:208 (-) Transcript_17083:332-955(-)